MRQPNIVKICSKNKKTLKKTDNRGIITLVRTGDDMPKITKTERQKHNRERVSVFVDGEYAFSVSDEIAAVYKIETDKDVNSLPLEEIQREDEYLSALKKAYSAVSSGAKTAKQIKDRLLRSGFSSFATERAIARVEENGYIDDAAYCEDFLRTTLLGKRGIEYKLRTRGVSGEIISAALENLDEDFFVENAKKVLDKNSRKLNALAGREKKAKAYRILEQNGYESDVIRDVLADFGDDEE